MFKIAGSAMAIPLLVTLGVYSGFRPWRKAEPVQQKAPPQQKAPSETALARAEKMFDEKGFNVTWSDCDPGVCRSVEAVPKKDDGFVYRYDNDGHGSLNVTQCVYNKNSKVGDQNWDPMIDRYREDARKKFATLELRALSTLDTPSWESLDAADESCKPTVTATFLLKADGRLYTATYKEKFSPTGNTSLRADVSNLVAVDKAPATTP